jgi:hypothetical protein
MAALTVWLRFLSGGFAGETRTVTIADGQAISIGRADDNQVVLHEERDFAASSYHAQLMNAGGHLYLYDSGSTNGTWIGGQRVQQVAVPAGTRVTFGRGGPEVEVLFQPAGAAPTPQPDAPPVAGYEPTRPVPGPEPIAAARGGPQGAAPPPALGGEKKTEPREFRAVPAMPSPAHMPGAYQAPVAPAIASDTCGMCGHLLFFVCYQCRRTLCASHYEPSTGVCVECAGAPAGGSAAAPAVAPPLAAQAGAAVPGGYDAHAGVGDPHAETGHGPHGAHDDDPEMRIPARRRRAAPEGEIPARRRGTPPADDDLPPRRRSGPPPADDELPPRRRRPS